MVGVDPKLLELPQVQAFLAIAEGLLTGTKKLVIETRYLHEDGSLMWGGTETGQAGMQHTFRVEDVK